MTAPGGAAADPVFRVLDLSVNFGGVVAVDYVNFDLARGEILGIIGPNGAGKTTVFDAISGFVNARGRIQLAGRDISRLSPNRRSRARLGRAFQDARLFPSLTVAETLAVAYERHIHAADPVSTALRLPWVARSERRIRHRVDELIELMGLGAFRDKFINELSTGSRRIVDLAVIMAHDPLVLLLDEPSSGIAQRETEALGPLLLRIREETGASLLVIEHDMPLIRSISDEILALETGKVVTRGKPDEVLADPRVVAAYLGTNVDVVLRSGQRQAPKRRRPSNERPPMKTARSTRSSATKKSSAAAKKVPAQAAKKVVEDATTAAPTRKKRQPTATSSTGSRSRSTSGAKSSGGSRSKGTGSGSAPQPPA